jgi:hypothetical protein
VQTVIGRAAWLAALVTAGCSTVPARTPPAPPVPAAQHSATSDRVPWGASAALATVSAPSCGPDSAAWRSAPPPADEEWIYGAGSGRSPEEAFERARSEVAASLSIQVRSETSDRQIDWQRAGAASGAQRGGEQRLEVITRSLVDRQLQACERVSTCQSPDRAVHLLARCSRQSALERQLRRAARTLSLALPSQSTLLVLPTTDENGLITGLGEYSAKLLNDILDRQMTGERRLKRLSGWSPMAFAELTRQLGVSHVVRSEFMAVGGQRQRFRLWVMDASNDQPLSGSSEGFDLELEAPHLELLDVRGPLFPQKAALDLAGAQGTSLPAELRLLSSRLKEGEEVEIEFKLPAASYVYLFDIYENGQASLVLPNPVMGENFFAPGVWHKLPDAAWKKAGMIIKACPVPGQSLTRESIKLVATATPLDLPLDRYTLSDLALLASGPKGTLAEIVKRINTLRARGVPISTATAPYLIEATPEARSGCPKG